MNVSRTWLQNYFADPLPDIDTLANTLTFGVAEIEEVAGDRMDVKVLPDRAAYLLSHRGVAREIGALLGKPLARDPLQEALVASPETESLTVSIEDSALCPRYIAAQVRGVLVGPSPAWLKEALESVGQRSINNVVDATNYVMLNIGQPLHAFDAGKLEMRHEKYSIGVSLSREGESITTLSGDEVSLPNGTLIITDAHADVPIGIAGIKGGKRAEVNESTTDIIIECANFDGALVRRSASRLKLHTDASARFQNKLSPTLTAYGMRDVLALIRDIAGGELVGVVDSGEVAQEKVVIATSVAQINGLLGSTYDSEEMTQVFDVLAFSYEQEGDTFRVTAPFERNDIQIPADLSEEVGRVLGYERISGEPLPQTDLFADQVRFNGIEHIKDFLVERGYTELSTQTFSREGSVMLMNPLDKTRPALRESLSTNMQEALTKARMLAPRVLGPDRMIKLFELGNVFAPDYQGPSLVLGVQDLKGSSSKEVLAQTLEALSSELKVAGTITHATDEIAEIDLRMFAFTPLGIDYTPKYVVLGPYHPFSTYPFALRDIAVWTPGDTEESEVSNFIVKEGGEYLVRIDLFDRFEKEGRTSYAFRLVFEAADRTLSDADLDPVMARITDALNAQSGYSVR